MEDSSVNKKPCPGESMEDGGSERIVTHQTALTDSVIPPPNAILPHLLPFQYTPDLAYSAYLLGYTGSIMGAARQFFPPSVLPPFGALPTPNFLQQVPLAVDNKPTSSKSDLCAITTKSKVERSHETTLDVEKFLNLGDNPIPLTVISNDTLPESSSSSSSSFLMTKTLSSTDITQHSEKLSASKKPASVTDLTQEEKIKMNRDRNREHARSTRLRKKAYVSKLKELVDGLHVERSEDARKRRVAIQHVAEVQRVRRSVIISFLKYLASGQPDDRKLMTVLEDNFTLKQPITPYRWFRPKEIDGENRRTTGIEGIKEEAASISMMIENIGSRCARWKQIKREEFLTREELKVRRHRSRFPHSVVRQSSCLQHAISSLSSSGSYKTNEWVKSDNQDHDLNANPMISSGSPTNSMNSSVDTKNQHQEQEVNYYHDYDAKPLPDPKLESNTYDTSDSGKASDGMIVGKHVCTDSSSGEEEMKMMSKKRKQPPRLVVGEKQYSTEMLKDEGLRSRSAFLGETVSNPSTTDSSEARMKNAPAIKLPPFGGIGKRTVKSTKERCESDNEKLPRDNVRSSDVTMNNYSADLVPKRKCSMKKDGDTSISNFIADNESSSSYSSATVVQAYYHVNEDDMIITGDVLMCPFIFRSQDAVLCGALADCVMPGMLRAQFSPRNKLVHMEMAYDAMGFMQQLERASGNEGLAQVIPNSLEMTLQPTNVDARLITMAQHPYLVVSVNEAWTSMTSFTQLDVEGKECSIFHSKRFDQDLIVKKGGKPVHDFGEVVKGFPSCSVNVYRDKHYKDIIVHVSSYPLTNSRDEITYLLHVWNLLPELDPFRHLG